MKNDELKFVATVGKLYRRVYQGQAKIQETMTIQDSLYKNKIMGFVRKKNHLENKKLCEGNNAYFLSFAIDKKPNLCYNYIVDTKI